MNATAIRFKPAHNALLHFSDIEEIGALLQSHSDREAGSKALTMLTQRCGGDESEAGRDEITAFQRAADEHYGRDGELEIDDGAVVSRGDDAGAYVLAWRWVTDREAGLKADE